MTEQERITQNGFEKQMKRLGKMGLLNGKRLLSCGQRIVKSGVVKKVHCFSVGVKTIHIDKSN